MTIIDKYARRHHLISTTIDKVPARNPILDAPRSLYPEFDTWLGKIAGEKREALILKNPEAQIHEISAIAILARKSASTAKLCTFCVDPSSRGVGASFLASICSYLSNMDYDIVYGTCLPEQTEVMEFFLANGFIRTSDQTFIKALKKKSVRERLINMLVHQFFETDPQNIFQIFSRQPFCSYGGNH